MERNDVLGMICGYYLSRFDQTSYAHLGFATRRATHEAIGVALGVPARSIRNWRDEFDPVHANPRQGWRNRKMHPSRARVVEALADMTESALLSLIRSTMRDPAGPEANILTQTVQFQEADDESVFALRGPTGVAAEEAFASHFLRTGEPVPGELVDRRHQQCGFDYEIVSRSTSAFVEVKGLAGRNGGVTFTDNEWAVAEAHSDRYFLALVRDVFVEPTILIFCNPRRLFDARIRAYPVVQVSWSVGERALRKAEMPGL